MRRGTPKHRPTCAACDKLVYAGNDAARMARRINHDQHDGWPVHAYRCPEGRGWHIGHVRRAPGPSQRRQNRSTR